MFEKKSRIVVAMFGSAMAVCLTAPAQATADPQPLIPLCKDADDGRAQGCFDRDGDHIETFDTYPDGLRAVTHWETDYGRSGTCHNTKGSITVRDCNHNMDEDGQIRIRVSVRNGASGEDQYMSGWSGWWQIG